MRQIKAEVTFPNESYPIVIPFDLDSFKIERVIGETVFGWYGDIYVSIHIRYIPEDKLKNVGR